MPNPIDPARLLWMKNVNHGDPALWAYCNGENQDPPVPSPPQHREFLMHWPAGNDTNAQRAKAGDLMLLCQRGRVTHLVEFLDDKLLHDANFSQFPVRRAVVARWFANPAVGAPLQNTVFGFDPNFRNGDTRRLDSGQGFQGRWAGNGDLPALQQHILAQL